MAASPPRRLLPTISNVRQRSAQNDPAAKLNQRPTTLPGIKTQIIPPEHPPPYNMKTSPPASHNMASNSLSSAAYLQPTAYTPDQMLTPDQQIVPVTTAYIYGSDGTSIPVWVTGTGEIISPASSLTRSRVLPSVPTQQPSQNMGSYLPQHLALDFPLSSSSYQSPYNSSNFDSLDRFGIHFENPSNHLFNSHSPNSMFNNVSSLPRSSQQNIVPQNIQSHPQMAMPSIRTSQHNNLPQNVQIQPQVSLPSSRPTQSQIIPDINFSRSNIPQTSQIPHHNTHTASPVMYATSPNLQRHINPRQHPVGQFTDFQARTGTFVAWQPQNATVASTSQLQVN